MTVTGDGHLLLDKLALSLRQNREKYTIVSTFSTKRCVPIIHKSKHEKAILSTKTTHFCLLFNTKRVPILALEVFTYLLFYKDKIEKLVYVSKADTTGLDPERCANIGPFVSEYLHSICELSIETLLKRLKFRREVRKPNEEKVFEKSFRSRTQYLLNVLEQKASGKKTYLNRDDRDYTLGQQLQFLGLDPELLKSRKIHVKLVLFTRSEGQYLFPESMKNTGKHILDGNKLLKWWLRNVDNISSSWNNCRRYLNILNHDEREVNRYFKGLSNLWKYGNVYDSDQEEQKAAIFKIPLLPDDPKGRFLEHLVVEGRSKKVYSNQYWQELAVRQEFSFGAVVGLIGVEAIVEERNDSLFQNLAPSELRKLTELVTTKDYSDQSDWGDLFEELQSLTYLKLFHTLGKHTNDHNKKARTDDHKEINTLLCVRKKAKK
ncbi:hypothetical protein CANINC_000965 [Pichia inconspicua]|uniref:histone acetyltransferase n=1 Tax=Pichia inconspicua TaxID=52247 RepID=A0A4T0X6I0_9ASCO|nr:hypothetical protein CANINC_000965 [[Candida] inconspicua]